MRPSLSVDSEMSVSGDMFCEMRAALGVERAILLNGLQPRPATAGITARDVLGFATREGARTVGKFIESSRDDIEVDISVIGDICSCGTDQSPRPRDCGPHTRSDSSCLAVLRTLCL